MTAWLVPKFWEGATVYIVGGGESLNTTGLLPNEKTTPLINQSISESLSRIHGERVIGVNDAYRLGDWIDMCWFGDARWFDWNRKSLFEEFKGLVVCCNVNLTKDILWVKALHRGKPRGLEKRPDYVSWNASSGGSAINFAVHTGAKKIVLIGYDMKPGRSGIDNWHNNHKVKTNTTNPYPRFLQAFNHIAHDAKEMGVEIFNTTMDSAIDEKIIPKISLEEIVNANNLLCS